MSLRQFKPINSSTRGRVLVDKRGLHKDGPCKSLTERIKNTGGRNNRGVITCRHRRNTSRRLYRIIDFSRKKDGIFAVVKTIEYDPIRRPYISLIEYEDGQKAYILSPLGLKVGDKVMSGKTADIVPGNCLELGDIPIGSFVHNIELNPGLGGVFCRTRAATLAGKHCDNAILKMPSGEMRAVSLKCRATIGQLSNDSYYNTVLAKAGNSMRKRRPTVRGVAMNPVDHANGGRTNGGKRLRNPTGTICKGLKTRTRKVGLKMILKRRGKK